MEPFYENLELAFRELQDLVESYTKITQELENLSVNEGLSSAETRVLGRHLLSLYEGKNFAEQLKSKTRIRLVKIQRENEHQKEKNSQRQEIFSFSSQLSDETE